MTVLVLDGGERSSLTMVRSLGKQKINVHAGEYYRFSLSSFSKYCGGSILYPNPQTSMESFIRGVQEILRDNQYDMVLSSREVTTLPLSYYKKRLEKYTIVPFPDWKTMEITVDKLRTFELAKELDIPMPETYYVKNVDELYDLKNSIKFPLVVKPRSKTTWVNGKPIMLKVTRRNYVHDFESLIRISKEIFSKTGKMPLIQEYIPGEGYGVELLLNDGKLRALFMHRRLREYPITGGASTFRESVYRGDLKQHALRIMEALNWHGVAMVEFKLDKRDNTPKLMEINGRFWGSLALSVNSGVDFPFLLYKMLTEGDVKPVLNYKIGVKCRWLLPGDSLWLLSAMKNRKDMSNTLKEFFSFRGMCYDILSKEDPFPALGAIRTILHQGWEVITGTRSISGEVKN